jgi:hypothetical protein
MSREVELLTEIRDLLEVIAEPALAKRDAGRRSSLRKVVGKSSKKAKAVLLMDGSRSQSAISKAAGIDAADVSRLVKSLASEKLISPDEKHPKVSLKLPPNFFDEEDADER